MSGLNYSVKSEPESGLYGGIVAVATLEGPPAGLGWDGRERQKSKSKEGTVPPFI